MIQFSAQEFPQYTQFIFNKIGYNPAASGTSINAPFEIIAGGRTQWIGVSNNPKSQFVSFNYNFVPQHSYSKWHNVGMYVDQDQNGAFIKNDVWLSYTFHLLLTKKMVLSAGVFVGIKQFKISAANFDRNDPAVNKSSAGVIAYPDVVPGVRFNTKKFFADFSLQQLTMYSQKGIGGQIGSPSRLLPHYIFSIGKKAPYNDYNTVMVALNLRGSVAFKPSVELNIMNYYDKKFAFGASIRSRNFISAIVQFRLIRNFNVGMAYDFSINKMLRAAPNTAEIMISISPVFGGEVSSEKASRRSVNDCTF
ncbi:MAG: type IX secretion system membrane protein PorP/SprF [Bacteroidetes bacterium]|nr:type IX secretion system membrane protein PorP/SprF [Bacteroidota bacterium]